MREVIVGIDLGTTNSEIAILRDGQPYVLPGDDGDPILPSFVGLADDGRLLVGKPARNQWPLAPDRTIKSIKRKMGEDVTVAMGPKSLKPQEVSSLILRTLKDRAEKALGHPVSKAVITVPAYFKDAQRQATIEAGQLAGLEVVRILNEPTAAALAYDPGQTAQMNVLVYDLGGGTFDVSIVRMESGVVEVLSSHGDTQLGGDDFDDTLLAHVVERFQAEHGVDPTQEATGKARLLRAVETAKRQLSDHPYVRLEEEFIAEKEGVPLHLSMELSRDVYEASIMPAIDRTMDCVHRAITDAHLDAPRIDRVVLVGGSTRTPLIGRLLEQRLGRPARREINPDLCVAMGAAVQGGIIAGEEIGAVLVDITPHSMGIKCLDNDGGLGMFVPSFRFAPIIPRGTALPASRSELFRTVSDRQKIVEIEVFQGESDDPDRNHRVGMFLIEGLAEVEAGNQILVQLELTADGVLQVSAREKATGLTKRITIDNALARYRRDEREAAGERLDELWDHFAEEGEEELEDEEFTDTAVGHVEGASEPMMPTLHPAPREGQRETVLARALIEKTERLRLKAAPEDQEELDRLMHTVRSAMEGRNWNALQSACEALSDVVFYLEDA